MNYNEAYVQNIKKILDSGNSTEGFHVRPKYEDGTPAHSTFITFLSESFNIDEGEFPIHTLRKTAWKSAIIEYLWIFQKQTSNLETLNNMGVKYWNAWDIGNGTIGKRYGATVRKFDLMNQLLIGIKLDPMGRRHIIDLYQYSELEAGPGLFPCQYSHTFEVRGQFIDLITNIRSSDFLVASTINKIQAIALLQMVCAATGYKPGFFHHVQANVHIYDRHRDNAHELVHRHNRKMDQNLLRSEAGAISNPKLVFAPKSDDFYKFTIDDFSLIDYEPEGPQLKFELGV